MPGISIPKWLACANQELLQFLVKWCYKDDDSKQSQLQLIQNSREFRKLSELADNPVVQTEFAAAKQLKKKALASYIEETTGFRVPCDSNTIFDGQCSPFIEERRFMMNILM